MSSIDVETPYNKIGKEELKAPYKSFTTMLDPTSRP